MTKRDFFRLVIKLFGVYQFFIIMFSLFPNNLSFIFRDGISFGTGVLPLIISTLFILSVFYFMIKNPDKIINLFKLDKGFDDEKITLDNFNSNSVLQIGFVFVGLFLIIDNISNFVSFLITYFKLSNSNPEMLNAVQDAQGLIFSGINVLIGFLFLIFRKEIAEKFE